MNVCWPTVDEKLSCRGLTDKTGSVNTVAVTNTLALPPFEVMSRLPKEVPCPSPVRSTLAKTWAPSVPEAGSALSHGTVLVILHCRPGTPWLEMVTGKLSVPMGNDSTVGETSRIGSVINTVIDTATSSLPPFDKTSITPL